MRKNAVKIYIMHKRMVPIKEAAKEIGYTPEHLYTVLNQKTKCGRKLAEAIADWSGGDLSVGYILKTLNKPRS